MKIWANYKENKCCVIFDIDGTLALIKENGRSPYNNEDLLNVNVYNLLIALSKVYTIIICTGRSEESFEMTVKWLKDYNITIYFRPYKNQDPDYLEENKSRIHYCIFI